MNQQIKRKWVDALYSGKYKQGMGQLRSIKNKFCCLGVLCDLYAQETGTTWTKDVAGNYSMGEENDVLPFEVCEWASIDRSPAVIAHYVDKRGKTKDQNQTLGDINDYGVPFSVIAKYIKEQL